MFITQDCNSSINENEVETEKSPSDFTKDCFDWIEVVVSAIVIVVMLFTFVFRVATIDGNSMQNTLFNGEKVIISNLFYDIKAGDIVVISRNKENTVDYYSDSMSHSKMPIIKRVIATEGQTVDIDFEAGKVYVDNKLVDDSYTKEGKTNLCYNDGVEFPLIVKEGCVFVLGDNRNDSLDSRSSQIGQVDTRYILGRVIIRIFPFNKIGGVN